MVDVQTQKVSAPNSTYTNRNKKIKKSYVNSVKILFRWDLRETRPCGGDKKFYKYGGAFHNL